jgi:hypothetical protein
VGTVTSVSVVSANGLAGSVATATSTPAITLTTSITGVLKGNGTAISAAVAGTDYQIPLSFVDNEVVSGSGTTYTLANTPIAGSVKVFGAGIRLTNTVDYTISGAVITITNGSYDTGEVLVDYRK